VNQRRVVFEYLDGLAIDIMPADIDLNPVYQAAVLTHLRPYTLAASLGRLSEERSEQLLARVYADGIIVGSPTDGHDKWRQADWEKWLLEHKEEFATLRSVAETPEAFKEGYGSGKSTESG